MKATTLITVLLGTGSLLGLAGCADPVPEEPVPAPIPSVTPAPMPPKTPLQASHALFDETNLRTSNTVPTGGAAFLAGLEAAGFAADTLETTTDLTSVGLKAPSIQFAALVDSTCLIGQYGPGDTGYRSVIVAPLVTGGCLVGESHR
ncbi:hypothetical protein G3T36_07625 [Diaminobutyricibacter tongyongensis]|uniref:DUF6993 domain-containing protein n=1 Tax=Leifsonia tongyongensis TaxID=1268043 RepID=A0A6L9XWD6_9MICO|nr:hypothetical protein [Diaminobutyricibacter tongyongensis]NEN05740.1 hypothetical protein [Diaminobutyricibacter tongyongensis]